MVKIRINSDVSYSCNDLYIGIGPSNSNFKSESNNNCWSIYSSSGLIYLQMKGNSPKYNNINEKFKKNDIIEVIVDRKLGNLSFSVNNINYEIAYSNIPKEEILYPIIVLYL